MTHDKVTSKKISDFKGPVVLFGGLEASPPALKSLWRIILKYFATSMIIFISF
jgi:hypothetical protein